MDEVRAKFETAQAQIESKRATAERYRDYRRQALRNYASLVIIEPLEAEYPK